MTTKKKLVRYFLDTSTTDSLVIRDDPGCVWTTLIIGVHGQRIEFCGETSEVREKLVSIRRAIDEYLEND